MKTNSRKRMVRSGTRIRPGITSSQKGGKNSRKRMVRSKTRIRSGITSSKK